jgi:hypothetical protein
LNIDHKLLIAFIPQNLSTIYPKEHNEKNLGSALFETILSIEDIDLNEK